MSKSFLSRGFDRYRVPYGRTPETVQRSVVFCGTVNDGTYLKDPTGHRRFWTVRCSDFIDTAGLGAARDQLWAEARVAYEAGEPWHLTREEEHTMGEEHELREETDPWEECVTDWIRQRGDRAFTMNELLERALGLKAHTRNPRTTQRVAPILDRLGFERRRRAALPRTHFYAKRAAHE